MEFSAEIGACSWAVPVPVVRSQFIPYGAAPLSCNVETDLGAIGAFDLSSAAPGAPVLYADLQTNADSNVPGRLGSGRSGFLHGHYLKGIGRTPLAANWRNHEDRYHNSGHLLPSAAIREYLASCALRAAGLASAINPCDALLVRPLDRDVGDFLHAMLPEVRQFPAIDHRFQAITVKRGDFARFSNFLWALDHASPRPQELARLIYQLHSYLLPPEERPLERAQCSPEQLGRAFAAAVERALWNFRLFARAGVHWGSFHNNFTADGRFVDLELPCLLGRPFFGATHAVLDRPAGVAPSIDWIGLELYSYVRQVRISLAGILQRLDHLSAHVVQPGTPREFLRAVAVELRGALPPDHPLHDRGALIALATDALGQELGLAPRQRALVGRIAAHEYDRYCTLERDWDASDVPLTEVPIRLADPEPGVARRCYYPTELAPALAGGYEAGELFNRVLRQIDASSSLEQLFARLEDGERCISQAFARAPQRPSNPPA
jgi:hypothetical protein